MKLDQPINSRIEVLELDCIMPFILIKYGSLVPGLLHMSETLGMQKSLGTKLVFEQHVLYLLCMRLCREVACYRTM